jgi:hypothetical protein
MDVEVHRLATAGRTPFRAAESTEKVRGGAAIRCQGSSRSPDGPQNRSKVMKAGLANSILEVFKKHATPQPYGCVNDLMPYLTDPRDDSDPDVQTVRKRNQGAKLRYGWRNLKEYFEVAGGWTSVQWKNTSYLEGVMLNGRRIPQPGASGIDWCGIFATYCWIKGGLPGARWTFPGLSGPDVVKKPGHKGLTAGDIAILDGPLWHHFLVGGFDGSPDKDSTIAISLNGNSDYQGITTKHEVRVGDIKAYYTVENPFLDRLEKMYGPSSKTSQATS